MISPELALVLQEAIDSALIDVHTGLPGVVQSYNDTTKTCEIEIQTKRMLEKQDGTYASEELPILVNVPISNAGSSEYVTAYALSPGDTGMVMFSETSLDQWRTKGELTSPSDIERHGLSGGVFYPAPLPIAKLVTDILTSGAFFGKVGGVQLRATGTTMEATTAGAVAASDFVALAALVLTELTAIKTAYDTHTHLQALPLHPAVIPTGPTGAPIVAMTPPGSVASTNLKAD